MKFVSNCESSNLVDSKFRIILGGWNLSQSVIRKNEVIKVRKNINRANFEVLRNHFRIIITDNSIQVKNMTSNEVLFGLYDDPDIIKNDLKFLLASGGNGGKGYLQFVNFSKYLNYIKIIYAKQNISAINDYFREQYIVIQCLFHT